MELFDTKTAQYGIDWDENAAGMHTMCREEAEAGETRGEHPAGPAIALSPVAAGQPGWGRSQFGSHPTGRCMLRRRTANRGKSQSLSLISHCASSLCKLTVQVRNEKLFGSSFDAQ